MCVPAPLPVCVARVSGIYKRHCLLCGAGEMESSKQLAAPLSTDGTPHYSPIFFSCLPPLYAHTDTHTPYRRTPTIRRRGFCSFFAQLHTIMKMLLFVEIPEQHLLLRTLERAHTHPHTHGLAHTLARITSASAVIILKSIQFNKVLLLALPLGNELQSEGGAAGKGGQARLERGRGRGREIGSAENCRLLGELPENCASLFVLTASPCGTI